MAELLHARQEYHVIFAGKKTERPLGVTPRFTEKACANV